MARTKKQQVRPVPSDDSQDDEMRQEFDESMEQPSAAEVPSHNENTTQQTTGQTVHDAADLRNQIRQRRQTTFNTAQPGHDEIDGDETHETADKKKGKPKGKVAKRDKPGTFKNSIHKVAKQVQPEFAISKQAMAVMDSMVADMFQRLASEASTLLHYGRATTTLTEQHVKTATALILNGELARHGKQEADKALKLFDGTNTPEEQQ